ncbi:DHA2 family efflux MFS transporter permease subunit [Alicyclobacillus fastidiosus]|uniref:DHA2 family efflux MFS transporter permease subunit n=1 Tax=Alicyclobacillus fastidiosus TaxID=392011 RepID=A0ABY6ZEM8_9BACL|nr:DHA2 family efflux MFS transporter permease subunit [Alicyclobacillus fastidiosus]WAH41278.1 DHA2 family efflux MFS transporter permease subunit [Alicyclobacillus fastidiosus]GMA62875.1 MFS transporter [Alicyclobacillus fastidiosus]
MKTFRSGKWWALGAMTLGVLAVGLDVTVLSIALPSLAVAFHATETQLQWFTSTYALALTAAMLPAGLLGDRYGRKRTLLIALGLFGLGSIFCAYASSANVFIIARTILGLTGAAVITLVLSALPVLFSETERPRAVGIWAAGNFVAMPIGPILGGWILTYHWWGWVFLMNVPVVLIGIAAILFLMQESKASTRSGIDALGITISSVGLVALTYGIIQVGQNGWSDDRAWMYLFAGITVLVLFVLWEHWLSNRGGQPLVDLALFRSRAFVSGVLLMTVGLFPMAGVLFLLPQYFQGVLGLNAEGSGVRLLPLVAGLIVGAVPIDRLVQKIGAKITIAIGFVVLTAGTWMASGTSASSSSVSIALWMIVIGIGSGMVMATSASAALMELSNERSGVGTALMQAMKNLGLPFGTAILGSVLNHAYQSRVNVSALPEVAAHTVRESVFSGVEIARRMGVKNLLQSVYTAFTHGIDVSFHVASGVSVAGILLALACMPHRSRETDAANH